MYNPFDGIRPGFGPFTGLLSSWVGIFLALIWALGLAFAAYHLVVAVAAIASARKQHRSDPESSAGRVVWPIVALIGLGLVPVIYVTATTPI